MEEDEGRLWAWLAGAPGDEDACSSEDASLAQRARAAIARDGYFVVRGVLSEAECEAYRDVAWRFVERTSPSISRREPGTWFPSARGGVDLWPHSGWRSFPDMCQMYQAGWVFAPLRETLAARVFEPLFGTRRLHCSKEGFTFHRPTVAATNQVSDGRHIMRPLGHPCAGRDVFVCGVRAAKSVGEHFDQSGATRGLHHIQSSVALYDQVEGEDGCFVCWPGSHRLHPDIIADTYRGNQPWVPLTDEELGRMEAAGLRAVRVPVRAGDLVLWRSDVAHAAQVPMETPRFRLVVYCAMLPAGLTPEGEWPRKIEAYVGMRTGDHRPECESWHVEGRARSGSGIPRSVKRATGCRPRVSIARGAYYVDGPPRLTVRQAQLHGLLRYDEEEGTAGCGSSVAAIDAARAAGVHLVDCAEGTTLSTSDAAGARLVVCESDALMGQDKWLGGVASPCGRYVYGVPGSAPRVLRITVDTGAVDFIGPAFPGKFKWLRGVEVPPLEGHPSGLCIALPSNASSVLRIDPATGAVTTFGGPFEGRWLWHGGELAANGLIYAIPANAERVLRIDPVRATCSQVGPRLEGGQKWYGGIIAGNGAIYGIPQTATGVIKIAPGRRREDGGVDEDDVAVIGEGSLGEGGWKWHGGVLVGSAIYAFPNNHDRVLKIDTVSDTLELLEPADGPLQSGRHRVPQDGRYKYLGGAVSGPFVYMFPCDAERVLRVDTRTDEVRCVGPELLQGENKWQNGFCGADGAVYAIPQRSSSVLRVLPDPSHAGAGDTVELLELGPEFSSCKEKFEGGVMGADGGIYCIPMRAKRALKILPCGLSHQSA